MTYEGFKSSVHSLIAKADNIDVIFSMDKEKGKFFAQCSDGVTIIGNSESLKITVKQGKYHMFMAKI